MSRLTLALDVMGGDIGPRVTIPASIKALESDPMLSLLLFGDSQQINPLLKNIPPSITTRLIVHHCVKNIENNQEIMHALRHSKGTSMRLAIEAVQKGEAEACISAGNTAALMGLAKLIIQPLKGILRPALISMLPTINGRKTVMLDLGANVECNAEHLHQFAIMGAIFAEAQLGLVYPRISLLNIGSEEIKGHKCIRQTAEILRQDTSLNYQGFIEGNQILDGDTDVIVSDGFVGNIALKTLEGAINNLTKMLTQNQEIPFLPAKIRNWLGQRIVEFQYKKLKNISPDRYNGAYLIGLNSVVVKSHGNANISAFYQAICDAARQVRQKLPAKVSAGLEKY